MDSRDIRQKTYGDLAVDMCKKWNIPVIDLYNEGGLNTQIPEFKANYIKETAPNGDKTHPNALGYDTFYVFSISFFFNSNTSFLSRLISHYSTH